MSSYQQYKKSKVSWLEGIPEHWEEKRAKYFFKEIDDRSQTGEEEMLSVSHITGVTPRSQKKVTMFKAESNIGQKKCQPGDVVINTMWAWMSALGVAKHDGIVSPSYGVYRPICSGEFNPLYLDDLLRAGEYRAEYTCRSTGIRSSRLRLYPDKFLSMPLACPPMHEQDKIARFLHWKTSKINQLIKNKRKLIGLFEERRNTITNTAITSSATRLLRLEVVADKIERALDREEEYEYIPIGLYNRGRGIFHKDPTKGSELGDSSFFWIKEGDLVFSGQFAWEGAVAISIIEDEGCIASHRYPIYRGKAEIVDSAYLLSFFRTKLGHMLLNFHSRGAAGRNRPLNASTLAKEKIPIPPLDIQKQIAELVRQEADLRKDVKKEETLLHEYHARLVSDVVTGKIDVRSVEIPDFEPVEADLEVQDDEESEDELITEGIEE